MPRLAAALRWAEHAALVALDDAPSAALLFLLLRRAMARGSLRAAQILRRGARALIVVRSFARQFEKLQVGYGPV